MARTSASTAGGRVRPDNQAPHSSTGSQPTSQFPSLIYGAQQDNSTVAIPSRTSGAGIDRTDWHAVGGGESGWIAPDLRDPNIVYAGTTTAC